MKRIPLVLMAGVFMLSACRTVQPSPIVQAELETIVAATLQSMTASAPPSGLPVSYQNISFRIPLELNASANAFTDTRWEFPSVNPSAGPLAAHAVFEFTNYPVEGEYPVGDGARMIVIKSSEYAADDSYEQDEVTALLAGEESMQPLPDALVMGNFYTQAKQVSFQNGHGLRYLTQLLDGMAPINNRKIFYYYQGVTNDGLYFVSAIFHVSTFSLVPDGKRDSLTPPDGTPFDWEPPSDYRAYLDEITQKLNDTSADKFTPSLAILDQLIESIQVTSP